jgi:hypothetical protein
MTRLAHTLMIKAQTLAVIALCLGAVLALPISLAAIGFQTA